MPRLAADYHHSFPMSDSSRSIPLGLAQLHASIAKAEWPNRQMPGHWLSRLDYAAAGCTQAEAAVFIWALQSVRVWLKSDEQAAQYALASKRVHFLPRGLARSRPLLERTVELHSTRGGQRIEALAALGFAFACGKLTLSLKPWRALSHEISHIGLGQTGQASDDDVAEQRFNSLRSRLNTARAELGRDLVSKRARETFHAFQFSAFPKV